MQDDDPLGLLPPPPGTKTKLEFRVVGPLQHADLPMLLAPPKGPKADAAPGVLRIRSIHHNIAQMIVKGMRNVEIAVATGYSPGYIGWLQNDPAFGELLHHYAEQRDAVFVDVMKRVEAVGLQGLELLQEMLEKNPEKFTPSQLVELSNVLLIKPQIAQKAATTVVPQGPLINVVFAQPEGVKTPGKVIDG